MTSAPRVSVGQVCSVLTAVCKKEGLLLPPELAKQISEKSGRNLRRALLMCEACRVQQWATIPPLVWINIRYRREISARLTHVYVFPGTRSLWTRKSQWPTGRSTSERRLTPSWASRALRGRRGRATRSGRSAFGSNRVLCPPPPRLLEVRARLYELLTHCIPPDVIMKVLTRICRSSGATWSQP